MIESKTIFSYLIEHMEAPSFKKVRDHACSFVRKLPPELRDELHSSLNRGIDILDSEALLQMYFYSYGEMHEAKLHYAFEHLQKYIIEAKRVELIDYGCGQGLASMCYHDYISNVNSLQEISRLILIEPSAMALSRASLLCSRFYPNAEIVTINKDFENLSEDDLKLSSSIPTIHLFSNILDVESYNIERFAHLIKNISKGDNEFVIVSPIQNTNRMNRLKGFATLLNNNLYYERYMDKRMFKEGRDWTCAVLICSTKNEREDFQFDYEKLYEAAFSIYKDKNRDESKCIEIFHLLNNAALNGDMKCQNILGCFYNTGIGTVQDTDKAFAWFEKSANQGFNKAIYNLAKCYELGKGTTVNLHKSAELFKKLCNYNFIPSYNILGIYYIKGLGVEKDVKKAIELWEYASNHNHPSAQYNLGYLYLMGRYVEKDTEKGLELLRSASNNGDIMAHRQLGFCYRDGIGVDIDMPSAIHHFTKAGLQNDKKSIISLIEIFEEKNYKKMFGNEQFDTFVNGVRLGITEIPRITATWTNKEADVFVDGDVVYDKNCLRVIKTLEHYE